MGSGSSINDATTGREQEEEKEPGLGVYVHWPYCSRICPYCDFNRYLAEKGGGGIDHRRMTQSYKTELAAFRRFLDSDGDPAVFATTTSTQTPGPTTTTTTTTTTKLRPPARRRRVRSVFFGGGTPSLAKPEVMEEVLAFIDAQWGFEPDAEITMEANPTSVEVGKLRDFRRAGVNRLSIGVQSLNADDLKFLGRAHSPEEALRAIELGKEIFPRVSFDLIYARHRNQTVEEWRKELQAALALASGHISLYTLTLEPGTAFFRRAFQPASPNDALPYPDDERVADLYEATVSTAAQAGYHQYEISNYAQPGHESRHNLIYWRSEDWIGIGPGAHGRLTTHRDGHQRHAFAQIKLPSKWMDAVENNGHGVQEMKLINPTERMEEALLNGLRVREGISPLRFRMHAGQSIEEALDMDKVAELQAEGFLVYEPQAGLRPTPRGMALLDALLPLLPRRPSTT